LLLIKINKIKAISSWIN